MKYRPTATAWAVTTAFLLALVALTNMPCTVAAHGQAAATTPVATTRATVTTTTTTATTDFGPDVILMGQLVDLYEPVPFEHRVHAEMAEMWDGCVTCHHRSPDPTTRPVNALVPGFVHAQDESAAVPACRSCHPVTDGKVTLALPSLKGAYHRQCLNCHREWSGQNDCVVCHQPRAGKGGAVAAVDGQPTTSATMRARVDDIVGRMHPPIPEPDEVAYRARFEPAVGPNVLFRHKEHTATFGLKCVECHRHDNCSSCHDAAANRVANHLRPRPLKPARTWRESHGPCVSCHEQDRCVRCHTKDGQPTPARFDHPTMTGQAFDSDHATIACRQCHAGRNFKAATPTCGGSECHDPVKRIAFPTHRPGPVATTQPLLKTLVAEATAPTTRPIRRATMTGGVR